MNDNRLTSDAWTQILARRDAENARTKVDGSVVTLQGVPDLADKITRRLVDALRTIRDADVQEMGTAWRASEIERVVDAARASLGRLADDTGTAVRTILEWQRAQDEGQGVDANERLLAEMQESRAWARMRAQLEAGTEVLTLIETARKAEDHRSLSALRAEFAAYAATAGRPVGKPADVDRWIVDALIEVAPKAERARLKLDRLAADATEAAERALDSVKDRVAAYGGFLDNPRPLDRAIRILDVERTTNARGPFAA